jgi:hypothetical protein
VTTARKPGLRAAIRALALSGLTHRQIAEAARCTYGSVVHHVNALVQSGEIPRVGLRRKTTQHRDKERWRLQAARERHGVVLGNWHTVLRALSDDQLDWLLAQVPKNATAADVVRAIIIDAYEDEQ